MCCNTMNIGQTSIIKGEDDGCFLISSENEYIIGNLINNLSSCNTPFEIINYNTINVDTSNVMRLDEYMKKNVCLAFNQSEKLIKSLGFFMDELERNRMQLVSIYLEDILVINDYCFIVLNDEKIGDITSGNTINVDWIDENELNSSELKKIVLLPDEVHYKAVYQNLAYLVFYSLFGDIMTDSKLLLHNLVCNGHDKTNLYYCINRCIHPDPSKREFIWV